MYFQQYQFTESIQVKLTDFYLQLINRIDFTFDWLDLHRKGLEITLISPLSVMLCPDVFWLRISSVLVD